MGTRVLRQDREYGPGEFLMERSELITHKTLEYRGSHDTDIETVN